jgi:hypothetical protein
MARLPVMQKYEQSLDLPTATYQDYGIRMMSREMASLGADIKEQADKADERNSHNNSVEAREELDKYYSEKFKELDGKKREDAKKDLDDGAIRKGAEEIASKYRMSNTDYKRVNEYSYSSYKSYASKWHVNQSKMERLRSQTLTKQSASKETERVSDAIRSGQDITSELRRSMVKIYDNVQVSDRADVQKSSMKNVLEGVKSVVTGATSTLIDQQREDEAAELINAGKAGKILDMPEITASFGDRTFRDKISNTLQRGIKANTDKAVKTSRVSINNSIKEERSDQNRYKTGNDISNILSKRFKVSSKLTSVSERNKYRLKSSEALGGAVTYAAFSNPKDESVTITNRQMQRLIEDAETKTGYKFSQEEEAAFKASARAMRRKIGEENSRQLEINAHPIYKEMHPEATEQEIQELMAKDGRFGVMDNDTLKAHLNAGTLNQKEIIERQDGTLTEGPSTIDKLEQEGMLPGLLRQTLKGMPENADKLSLMQIDTAIGEPDSFDRETFKKEFPVFTEGVDGKRDTIKDYHERIKEQLGDKLGTWAKVRDKLGRKSKPSDLAKKVSSVPGYEGLWDDAARSRHYSLLKQGYRGKDAVERAITDTNKLFSKVYRMSNGVPIRKYGASDKINDAAVKRFQYALQETPAKYLAPDHINYGKYNRFRIRSGLNTGAVYSLGYTRYSESEDKMIWVEAEGKDGKPIFITEEFLEQWSK